MKTKLTRDQQNVRDQQIIRRVEHYLDLGFGLWYAYKLVGKEYNLSETQIYKIYNKTMKR